MEPLERGQQPAQVLARLDGADEEQIAVRQPVAGAGRGDLLRRLRAEARVRGLVDHGDLLRRDAVGGHHVAFALLGYRDDVAGAAAEERHGGVEIPAVEPLVVRRVAPEDQVVDGEHRGHAAQRQQQVLGGMVQRRAGQQPVEADPPQLAQPHQHPPRLVAQVDGGRGDVRQPLQRFDTGLAVIEEGEGRRFGGLGRRQQGQQGAGQAFGVAAQPGAAVDGGGDVEVDGHGV